MVTRGHHPRAVTETNGLYVVVVVEGECRPVSREVPRTPLNRHSPQKSASTGGSSGHGDTVNPPREVGEVCLFYIALASAVTLEVLTHIIGG